jgi:hypothetical protein
MAGWKMRIAAKITPVSSASFVLNPTCSGKSMAIAMNAAKATAAIKRSLLRSPVKCRASGTTPSEIRASAKIESLAWSRRPVIVAAGFDAKHRASRQQNHP